MIVGTIDFKNLMTNEVSLEISYKLWVEREREEEDQEGKTILFISSSL